MFQQLTGLGRIRRLERLLQAPFTLHESMVERIEREAIEARAGRKARIVIKLNSLVEPQVVAALYRASRAGVEIDLIVRGVCCLKPGIPGLSERIRVRSIVGRFLEHSRICWFHAGGEEVVICSSADWMGRNFFRRIEAGFPVALEAHKTHLTEALEAYLADEIQAWLLGADGGYERCLPAGEVPHESVQNVLLNDLRDKGIEAETSATTRRKRH